MHRSILEKYPIHLYLNHLPIPSAEQGTVNNPYKRIQSEEAPLLFTIEETFLISCSIKKDESFTSDLDEISPRPKQQDRTTRGSSCAPSRVFFPSGSFFYRTPMTRHSHSLLSVPSKDRVIVERRENGRGSSSNRVIRGI